MRSEIASLYACIFLGHILGAYSFPSFRHFLPCPQARTNPRIRPHQSMKVKTQSLWSDRKPSPRSESAFHCTLQKAGEPYSQGKVEASIQALQRAGRFDKVTARMMRLNSGMLPIVKIGPSQSYRKRESSLAPISLAPTPVASLCPTPSTKWCWIERSKQSRSRPARRLKPTLALRSCFPGTKSRLPANVVESLFLGITFGWPVIRS